MRLYAARGVHCSLPAFAHAQSWPLLTNPQPFLATSPPRDEHERLREVRVRPEGNGATKKPQHSLRLFLVHHRGLSRGLRNAALWRSLRHLRAAALFEYLRWCTRSCLLEIEQQKNALHFSCKAFFGAPSGTRTQDPLIKSQLLYQLS